MEFKDLPPSKDPKGGSPKTPPGGIALRDYSWQTGDYPIFATPTANGHGVWRAISTGLGGLVVGLIVAWFTAFVNKGVTQSSLEDYIEKHSPYLMDKQAISEHNQNQDRQIGELIGKQDRTFDRLNVIENKVGNDERELTDLRSDLKSKTELIANLLDEQRKAKK